MPDSESSVQVELLPEKPAQRDLFKGKAHDRIAAALVEILCNGSGGRAIGLEGTWGSGKSTVIEIASDLLRIGSRSSGNWRVRISSVFLRSTRGLTRMIRRGAYFLKS